jgi:hypothetical protein
VLAERVLGDEHPQLRGEDLIPAEPEQSVQVPLDADEAKLSQPRGLVPHCRVVVEPGERLASAESQRSGRPGFRHAFGPLRKRSRSVRQETLKSAGVELLRVHDEPIAAALRHEPAGGRARLICER